MTTLRAAELDVRLAATARRGGSGRVHSVFRTAANLQVNGQLLCILGAGRPLHPLGVVLAAPARLDTLGLAPGQPVQLAENAITLAPGGAEEIQIGLEGAVWRDLSVEALEGLEGPRDWDEKLRTLALATAQSPGAADGLVPVLGRLAPGQFPEMPQNHWCNFLFPRLLALPATLRQGDAKTLRAAGRALAGCGPGLTPSSDDLLAGFLAGVQAAARADSQPLPGAQAACRMLAEGAQAATGDIPAAYLRSAADGCYSPDMLALLAAFFSAGPCGAVADAALRVAQFGSSSGSDMLAGLWLALYTARHSIG